jgi:hypothetical protein
MIVTNDRPQGGSVYKPGRIELMLNRHGKTNDMLGVLEPMEESDSDGNGLNVSASFTLAFTKSQTDAQNLILIKQNMNMSPLLYFYAIADSKTIDSTFPAGNYI